MSGSGFCALVDRPDGGGPRKLCAPDYGGVEDAWTEADQAREDRRVARHEAAHAVVALALGRHVEYVSVIQGDPHAMHRGRADGPRWLHDSIFVTLAGRLGEGEARPPDLPDQIARVRASRGRCLGECDDCKVAYYLAGIWGSDQSDADLALAWTHMRATTLNLLDHPVVAEAVDRVAAALGRRPLLLADDLAVIVNPRALRVAAAELLPQRE